MGMMKRMKDMRDMVNAAPGIMQQAQEMQQQAQQMGAQAQQYAAAQQAAAQAQMAAAQGQFAQPGAAPTGPDFEPIAGVSLELFAAISKGVAAYNYDAAKLPEIAASKGVDAATWDEAARAWNDRIKANPAVAQRFNVLYRAA
jgi:ATP/maltotriose-dependent transcriptional regulator MalT